MNLCGGLWVKEALNCAPEKSEPLACINDEHPAQRLVQEMYNRRNEHLLDKIQHKLVT